MTVLRETLVGSCPYNVGSFEADKQQLWSNGISCVYCAFRLSSPNDVQNWQVMAAIKSNILRRMDSASPGVRICCIKFVQRVVQVETPGLIADPRVRYHSQSRYHRRTGI
jgi:hypothetical protein